MFRRQLYIVIILCLVNAIGSEAQVTSNDGTFSVAFAKGCAPFTVNITQILALDPNVSRQYSYEGEVTPTLDTFHIYTEPGIYNIAQILGQDANKFDTLTVEVVDPVTPSFRVNQCSGNGVTITASDENYDFYRIYFTDNDSIDLNPDETSPVFQYGSTGGQPIRVRGLFNDAENNCGEAAETINTISQLSAGTITELNTATIGTTDGAMLIRFNLPENIIYDLEVITNDQTDFQLLQRVSNTSNLTISGLNTEEDTFCFRLSVVDACTGEQFISNSVCTARIDVEANNGFHELTWQVPNGLQDPIEIFKDGEFLTSITDTQQRSLIDSLVSCGSLNCYVINIPQGNLTFATPQACATGISIAEPPPINDITATVTGESVSLSWRIAENGAQILSSSGEQGALKAFHKWLDLLTQFTSIPARESIKLRLLTTFHMPTNAAIGPIPVMLPPQCFFRQKT